jgi:hypothetical protein
VLIHLDGSAVAEANSNGASAPGAHASIENLLLAHFEGTHVVLLFPDDARALQRHPLGWSPRARRALEHIDDSYPQISGLRDELAWSIALGIGADFEGSAHEVAPGCRVIRLPLQAFARVPSTALSVLLGENRTDADLFVELGLMMRALRRWDGIDLNHEPRGGGGDTTAIEFQGLADHGRMVLAVGDTDQRHPGSAVGGTYGKLARAAQGRPAHQRARPLHVRTAEALVPMAVYREVLTSPERLTGVNRTEQLLRSAPADLLRYAHLKDGLKLHQVESPRTEAEGAYWRGIAENAGRESCKRPTREQCTKREECGCYVVDPLGGQALVDVVAWMKTRKPKRALASRFGLPDDRELAALADEVLAWGVALAPLQA